MRATFSNSQLFPVTNDGSNVQDWKPRIDSKGGSESTVATNITLGRDASLCDLDRPDPPVNAGAIHIQRTLPTLRPAPAITRGDQAARHSCNPAQIR